MYRAAASSTKLEEKSSLLSINVDMNPNSIAEAAKATAKVNWIAYILKSVPYSVVSLSLASSVSELI